MPSSIQETLTAIEQDLEREQPFHPNPMPGDKWLLSSAMQKAIRRGQTERATQAAASLYYHDKQSFWRRLHIIALEDVGIASTGIIIQVLTATAATQWRNKQGDLRVGLYLVKLLCAADKIRLSDTMVSVAEKSGEYQELRAQFSRATDDYLADIAGDAARPLAMRCLALWYLAGTQKYPSDHMPMRLGSLPAALSALRSLSTPAALTPACEGVISRSPYPLALITPLCWQEVQKHPAKVVHEQIPAACDVLGLPLYAADMFTRAGKTCIRQLQQECPKLQSYSTAQLGHALFYLEGSLIDKRLASPGLDALRQAGEIADMEATGMGIPCYLELQERMIKHIPVLNSIRKKQLHRYLSEL